MYSNVSGDFSAAPVAGTKRITLTDFANGVISGDLSVLNFIRSTIYSHIAGGPINKLPTTSLSYSAEDGLTLHDLSANFSENETVAIYIHGRDKGFDEDADAYKITGGGGGAIENYALEAGGALDAIAGTTVDVAVSLAVMETWDETARAKVNLIAGQAGVQGGSGEVSASTQRTVLATDVGLPAGSNTIGNVIDATPQGSFHMTTTALKLNDVIKASPGTLLFCRGRLDMQASTGQVFLQFYDAISKPADGAVTIVHCETIEHINGFSSDFEFKYPRGKDFSTGLCYCLSTTEFEKTEAVGEAFISMQAEIK